MRIVAILLAAGRGSRFGGDKLLAPLAGGTPLGVQAARSLKAVFGDTVAVVRPEDDALARLLRAAGVEVLACPDAHLGMGSSLAHGVRARSDADAWVVALADMPLVRSDTLVRIAAALRAGALIAAPCYRGERGHPVGFAASLGARLAALSGDVGAREVVQAERAGLVLVEVDDAGVLADIDTQAELASVARGELPRQRSRG
ncbi:MAG: nucleotidyltransferase family protein [Burkholderiales bacterium]|nr:nucleotidyltransferase family protein [Burkholderiales bacterium]